MNEKITIPENTRVIIEDGVIIFERKEVIYKANEWYSCRHTVLLTTEALADNNEFYCSGFELDGQEWVWFENRCCDVSRLGKADMKEVTRLLIWEAEKRGCSKNSNFIDCDGYEKTILSKPWFENGRVLVEIPSGIGIIFESKTGKWAEIKSEPRQITIDGVLYIEKT
jgi:hypothetical protein